LKQYVITEDRKGNNVVIHDEVLVRHALFPFWMFSNPRPDLGGGAFFCFIGCNFPDGIQNKDEAEWHKAMSYMNKGFVSDWAKTQGHDKRVGWGGGETPTAAFRAALRMSGAFREGGSKAKEAKETIN